MSYSGIEKIIQQSENLGNALKDSRRKREEDSVKFICDMKTAQDNTLAKGALIWSKY